MLKETLNLIGSILTDKIEIQLLFGAKLCQNKERENPIIASMKNIMNWFEIASKQKWRRNGISMLELNFLMYDT